MILPNWYTSYKNIIEISINKYLIEYFKDEKNIGLLSIKEATLYAVKGGKRIRSILALEFFKISEKLADHRTTSPLAPLLEERGIGQLSLDDDIIKFCVALELLHAYSLVHDDLPCMDNDEFRRGELTVWKKYGEATATLVGDLLNSLSFEILGKIGNSALIKYFGKAVGLKGMIGGQVLDLYFERNIDKLTLENLLEIHNKKTGALIEVSILGGLLLGNKQRKANEKLKKAILEKYIEFGKKIGLAFQVKDDLIDVEGNFEQTGKSVGGEKKGFVYFLGIEKTKQYLDELINDCLKITKELKSEKINFLIGYIKERTN